MRYSRYPILAGLSPCCACLRCTQARGGWLTAWIPTLARKLGVSLEDAVLNDPIDLLSAIHTVALVKEISNVQ